MKTRRIGLRLQEIETAFAANLDAHSPGLRHYQNTRLLGQAIRLAQLIRGMDVIEDLDRLTAIAAGQLNIDPMHFDAVLKTLEEADLVQLRTNRLLEKVHLTDFGVNYERVGEIWVKRPLDSHEQLAVGALDELVIRPKKPSEIQAFSGTKTSDRIAVREVLSKAHLTDEISIGASEPVLFSPMLWDVAPEKVATLAAEAGGLAILEVVQKTGAQAGIELGSFSLTKPEQALANRAISIGLLPTIPVDSTGGLKEFTFTPYSGALVRDATEREILGRARAMVACVRYGQRHAVASRIRYPVALLSALLDPHREHTLKAHSEMKGQYAQLVKRGIGRIIKAGGWYKFQLIPSKENQRAVKLAIELISTGEILKDRDNVDQEQRAALFANGRIGTEFDGIREAHKRVRANDDELEELVETLRNP